MRTFRNCIVSGAMLVTMTSTAFAACDGSTGRGWSSGNGSGTYEMSSTDKTCLIPFVGFFSNNGNDFTPATEISLRRAPKSGSIGVSSSGIVYTPNPGFTGKDRFCTINRSDKFAGETLAGCYTVTVR